MNVKTLSTGIIVGVVAGAVATLLSTPKSGQELRGSIKDTKDNWSEHVLEIQMNIQQIRESIQQVSKEGKETVSSVASELKESISQWKKSADPNIENLQEEIAAIQAAMEELEKSIQKDHGTEPQTTA